MVLSVSAVGRLLGASTALAAVMVGFAPAALAQEAGGAAADDRWPLAAGAALFVLFALAVLRLAYVLDSARNAETGLFTARHALRRGGLMAPLWPPLLVMAVVAGAGGALWWHATGAGDTTLVTATGEAGQPAEPEPAHDHDEDAGQPNAENSPAPPAAPPADALPGPGEEHSAVAVAVAMAREAYPTGGSEHVLLGRDTPSADALAAGGLQGRFDSPLLLTDGQTLSPQTAEELDRHGTPTIHVLGGEQVISPEIAQQLRDAGHNVHRHSGPTRVETAINIAELHFPDSEGAVLTSAYGDAAVAEAIAAGGLAAARQQPVLLTTPAALSATTRAYLEGSAIQHLTVVGNESAVGEAVIAELEELGLTWDRVAGGDRYATAVAIAEARGFATAGEAEVVILVEGSRDTSWPGGFNAAMYAARHGAPIILTDGDALPEPTAAYLRTDRLVPPRLMCTPGVSEAACTAAWSALGAPR